MKKIIYSLFALSLIVFAGCGKKETKQEEKSAMQQKVDEFALVSLNSDLSHLSANEKELIKVFLEIGQIMDDLFWKQAYGNKTDIDTIKDEATREFAKINYGPWERLNDMKPFVQGYGEKPKGACFYPADMTKEEYDNLKDKNKDNLYTVIRRDENGKLVVKWYREEYKEELAKVDALMEKAIALADDAGLKKYLTERRKAFQTDDYFASDMAWMDMKTSKLDFIVGPIENYEDRLFGSKAAYESFILVKDKKWSKDLAKFTSMFPELQTNLPCDDKFKNKFLELIQILTYMMLFSMVEIVMREAKQLLSTFLTTKEFNLLKAQEDFS